MKKLLLLSLVCANHVMAQNEISGHITDARTHHPLPSVSVYLPALKAGAVSDAQGHYLIRNLPAGSYVIEASLVGFTTQAQTRDLHGEITLDFSLEPFIETLPVIIQTGTAEPLQVQKSPLQVGLLSGTELLENSYTNITDAVASVPGVSQTTEGQSISKPFIRGLGYNRVVVIVDGIRQEGQQWFDEFGIEADENAIEAAEVLKGPGSLRYGSDAIAGVINYLPPRTLPTGDLQLRLLSEYQTNSGLYNNSLDFAGNQKGFVWDLRYSAKEAHDYRNPYDGYVWNSGMTQHDFRGMFGLNRKWGYSHVILSAFDYKLGIIEGTRDSATGQFTTHFLDANGDDSLGIAPASGDRRYNYFPIIHQHIRHYKAVLDNNFVLGKSQLQLTLGMQQNYRQEANDITVGDIYNNYFFSQTFTYDALLLLPAKNNWNVSAGINGMDRFSQDRGLVFLIPEYHAFDGGAFSIIRKTVRKLTLSGGLRYDVRHLQTHDLYVDANGVRESKTVPGAEAQFKAFSSDFSGLSGSIGAVYDFTRNLYGKINFSRGYRAPAINEAGANGIHDGTPFFEIGDPHLKAESSFQADATFGVKTKDVTGEIDVYRNEINHYIFPEKLHSVLGGDSLRTDVAANLEGPAFKYIAGDAVLSGIEALLDIHPAGIPWLRLENSFSTIRAIQKHQPDSTKYLPYTPPGQFNTRVRFTADQLGALHGAYVFIGINDVFEQNKIYYKYGDETITPGYTLLNAGIGADLFGKKGKLFSVYITGNNLANKAYQSSTSLIKYADPNNVTGRIGVYNMGRNVTFKILVPVDFKK